MNKRIKKIIAVSCCALCVLSAGANGFAGREQITVNAAISTNIGSGLSYQLSNNNKTLTISGSGTMKDFTSASAVPWRGSASSITKVVFSSGVSNIGAFAFAYCTNLKYITIPDNIEKIGAFAFYNSGLEAADYNAKGRIINENAFSNTPFARNYLTSEKTGGMGYGAAATLTGRQVVVNIFMDSIYGSFKCKQVLKRNELSDYQVPNDCQLVNYMYDKQRQEYQFELYEKKSFKYQFVQNYGYDLKSTSSFNGNTCATSLNDYKYFEKSTFSNIDNKNLNKVGNDKYVTSKQITNIIAEVGNTLSSIKSDAKEYGKTVDFITNKDDTNLYFTYNGWSNECSSAGNPYYSDSVEKSLVDGETPNLFAVSSSASASCVNNNKYEQFNKALKAKKGKGFVFDTDSASTAEYTNYLKNKYNANGVIYLIHLNTNPSTGTTGQAFSNSPAIVREENRVEENAVIFSENSTTMKHEICHLYGAIDYYNVNSIIGTSNNNDIFYKYANKLGDLMSGSGMIGSETAYSIGWSNTMMKDTFDVLFLKKSYPMGDVDMDGLGNTDEDKALINAYAERQMTSVYLTPLQKVLGNI